MIFNYIYVCNDDKADFSVIPTQFEIWYSIHFLAHMGLPKFS